MKLIAGAPGTTNPPLYVDDQPHMCSNCGESIAPGRAFWFEEGVFVCWEPCTVEIGARYLTVPTAKQIQDNFKELIENRVIWVRFTTPDVIPDLDRTLRELFG